MAFLLAHHSDAAVIQWASRSTISGNASLGSPSSVVYAYTFGDASVKPAVVNGVSFTAFPVPDLSTSTLTVGNVSLGLNAGNQFSSTGNGLGSSLPPFSNLTTEYQALLESGVSTVSSGGTLALTLRGLTVGRLYQLQFWTHNSNSFNLGSQTVYTPGLPGDLFRLDDNTIDASGGTGEAGVGYFIADTSLQVVSLQSSMPEFHSPRLNALVLRTIPEPSSSFLLVSAAVLSMRRGRAA